MGVAAVTRRDRGGVTPLGEKLAALIAANGPMTVAEYMAACLGDPEHGYYMRREPFGRGGDFITAPEISQIFGELIGAWAAATWEAMGRPSPFILAELGPGRGTLTADLIRAARVRPEFGAAVNLHLVESSPRLRTAQGETLARAGLAATWHDRIESPPAGPLILVANEFFDALPIRQFVRTEAGWAERMVGVDADGRLAFGLRASEQLPTSFRRKPESIAGGPTWPAVGDKRHGLRWTPASAGVTERSAPEGEILETSPAAAAIMSEVASRIAKDGGAALIIDYGYASPAFGDTLQAVRHHRYDDPLAAPGEADLTAHVDFAALARAASEAGARPRPVTTQGELLARLGIAARAERLSRDKDAATRAAIASAAARLTAPEAMGELFKVLAVSKPDLALPAFDDDV